MHSSVKKVLALALALCLTLSIGVFTADAANSSSFIVTTPTGYTSAGDVQYVQGNYIANWGARGETCVFLSRYAQAYYTGSYTYNALTSHAGGNSQSDASQSDLYKTLQAFMRSTSTHQTSYNETKDLYKFTDCLRSDTSHISSFYSGRELKGQWDGGSTWNREHTWPNSKGMNGNDENDIMMLRPTWVQENTNRGNTAYGEGSGYYDPGLATHGDCARIALYVYVRWGNTGKMWGTAGVIENLDILLKWMAEDPVDTWEMGRNDAVQSITGVRNVFIDYPELAWLLFGKEVPASLQTPSHNNGNTTPVIPVQPTDPQPTTPQPTQPTPSIREYAIPVSSLTANSIVFLYHDQSASVMTSVASGTGLKGVAGTKSGSKLGVTDDMLGLSVSDAGNGYFTLQSPDGKYLTAGESGNALTLESSKTDCSLWTINANGILNYGAKYSGKDQYLEYYSGRFTTYGLSENNGSAPYTFHFFALESSMPVDPGPTPTDPVVTEPVATQPVVTPPSCSHTRTTLKNAFEGSCTKEGYSGDTYCADCGKLLSQGYALPKQEHIAVVDSGMEATCIQPGKEGDTVCKICGTVLKEGAEIPATGNHPFRDWEVTKAPTATEDGERSRICAVCDLVEKEVIPATGPAPTEPTSTEPAPTESVPAVTVPPQTHPAQSDPTVPHATSPQSPAPEKSDGNISTVVIASGAAIAAAAGGAAFVVAGKRRKKEE